MPSGVYNKTQLILLKDKWADKEGTRASAGGGGREIQEEGGHEAVGVLCRMCIKYLDERQLHATPSRASIIQTSSVCDRFIMAVLYVSHDMLGISAWQ